MTNKNKQVEHTPEFKTCSVCHVEKPTNEFHISKVHSSGFRASCKICANASNRKAYMKNAENRKAQVREYGRANADKKLKRNRLYVKTKKGKDVQLKAAVKWAKNNPEKMSAHNEVSKALYNGNLTKSNCVVCDNCIVEAHHEDYTKPLDVVWLCRKHHAEVHRNLRDLDKAKQQLKESD